MYIYTYFLNHNYGGFDYNYGMILHVIRIVKIISVNFPEIRDASIQNLFLPSL